MILFTLILLGGIVVAVSIIGIMDRIARRQPRAPHE
jgi:hypothetical protein